MVPAYTFLHFLFTGSIFYHVPDPTLPFTCLHTIRSLFGSRLRIFGAGVTSGEILIIRILRNTSVRGASTSQQRWTSFVISCAVMIICHHQMSEFTHNQSLLHSSYLPSPPFTSVCLLCLSLLPSYCPFIIKKKWPLTSAFLHYAHRHVHSAVQTSVINCVLELFVSVCMNRLNKQV